MKYLVFLLGGAALFAAPPAAQPPQPAYDRTLSTYTEAHLPSWLKLSGEFRTRLEGRTGFNFQPENDDAYGLFRTRVNIQLIPTPWMQFYFQGQDSRISGIDPGRPLGIFKDPFDIRQAYVRLGSAKSPVKLTAGRQLLLYGGQRIIGPLDWTNTSRNWDAVKLELGAADAKVDLFASSVVVVDPAGRVNQPRRGYNLHGAYGSFQKIVPKASFEPYLLWKTGNASIWSAGFRLAAMPGTTGLYGFDYQLEAVRQWGRVALQDHSAWASSLVTGYSIAGPAWKPHVSAEYSCASGDRNPGVGTHRTFDHILGTNHLFYGLVDAVGWQNMHNVRIGGDAKPHKKLQVNIDYHWLWLDSPRDALYDVAGRATVRPKAGNTAREIGTEFDITAMWAASTQWKVGGGVGILLPGRFLKENSGGAGQRFPYVFAQYSF
jgi:hypothetical protein